MVVAYSVVDLAALVNIFKYVHCLVKRDEACTLVLGTRNCTQHKLNIA